MRFSSSLLLALSALLSSLHSCAHADDPPAPAPSRPNIVLCMADDQGWGDMGSSGHPVVQTPNLDAMAKQSLRFHRFYAAAPVCSPTRASVLTGRHPNRSGCFAWGHVVPGDEWTLAEALRERGYATGHFGKWHVGSLRSGDPTSPGEQGFEEWVSSPNYYDLDPSFSDRGAVVETEGEGSDVSVDFALRFSQHHPQSSPSQNPPPRRKQLCHLDRGIPGHEG